MNRIPCAHETGNVPHSVTVEDYHPLSRIELADLLFLAKSETGQSSADIQVRIGQGLPGLMCPRAIDSPIAAIDFTFVSFKRGEISLGDAVSEIYKLFNPPGT